MSNPQLNYQAKSYQISDSQPKQPFSYNLNQPVPAFLNQRVHPAEMNNLDMNSVLIQPKPVPTIPQMPSLPNMMNPNLMMNLNSRYSNKNLIDNQAQLPPLPNKNSNQWSNPNTNPDCPPKAPPRRKSFANGSNTYLNKKGPTNHVKVSHRIRFDGLVNTHFLNPKICDDELYFEFFFLSFDGNEL